MIPKSAARQLIDTINATGGLLVFANGTSAPAEDEDWTDLGFAYEKACEELGEPILFYNHADFPMEDWEEETGSICHEGACESSAYSEWVHAKLKEEAESI